MEELRVYTSEGDHYAVGLVASIGNNIRVLRIAAGYKTQGGFAKALGIPQPRLSDWENDRYGIPEVPNLLKIAKKLEVSLDVLLGGVDAEYDELLNDLSGHGRTGKGASTKGGADVPAEARVRELEGRLSAYEAIINRAHALGVELGTITVIGAQGSEALRATAKRGRRH